MNPGASTKGDIYITSKIQYLLISCQNMTEIEWKKGWAVIMSKVPSLVLMMERGVKVEGRTCSQIKLQYQNTPILAFKIICISTLHSKNYCLRK